MSLAAPPRRLGKSYQNFYDRRERLLEHKRVHPRTWTRFEERQVGRLSVALDRLSREIAAANRRFVLAMAAAFRRTPLELPPGLDSKGLFDP